jgi:hypothetical protein
MSYGHYPSSPRRLPASIYWRRRLVAIGVVLFVGYGVYSVGQAVFGGARDANGVSTGGPDGSPAVNPVTVPTPTQPGDTAPPPASTTSTTSPDRPPRQITADAPAMVYIAGDSDAGAIGPSLTRMLADTGFANTTLDYHNSTGLSRPDFFDWGQQLNEQVPVLNPDIVVFAVGGNDAYVILDADKNLIAQEPTGDPARDAAWRAEYGRRVGATMDYLVAGGRTLIWVGIPNAKSDSFNTRLRVQDDVVKAEAAKRPGRVIYIDTWQRFTGLDGGYAEFVQDPTDGVFKDVRSKVDDWHLNENGAKILALDITAVIIDELRERGAPL